MPAAVLPARFLVNTKLDPKLHSIDSARSREEGAPRGRPFFTAFRLSKKPSCKEFKSSADDGIKYNPVISGDMCLGNDTSLGRGAHRAPGGGVHSRPCETAGTRRAAAAVLHCGAAGPPFVGAHIMRPAGGSRPPLRDRRDGAGSSGLSISIN